MKRFIAMLAGAFMLFILVSAVHAITITTATISAGAVLVEGSQAARAAIITWEGQAVTKTNNGGAFKFSTSNLPSDCVGQLSDGVSTVLVVINHCTPAPITTIEAGVPKTGQTICYDPADTTFPITIIACAGTGQDGDVQAGVASPNPRFTDNGDGTVTDNLTGLIWLQNANCSATTRVWATALTDVASLNSSGAMNSNDCGDTSNAGSHQTDWRLPNVRELQSLVDYGTSNPSLPAFHPFTNIQTTYWSSTTGVFNANGAWVVALSVGAVNIGNKVTTGFFVIAVRGGL